MDGMKILQSFGFGNGGRGERFYGVASGSVERDCTDGNCGRVLYRFKLTLQLSQGQQNSTSRFCSSMSHVYLGLRSQNIRAFSN